MDLNQMMVFAKVAEFQSFTKAGRKLGIEKSNVSTKVSKLENRLGVRLLNRTTRSVTLTEAGEGYYQFCLDILVRAEEADAYAESLNSEPRGTLRITAAVDAGRMIVKSLIKPFLEQYQQIKVDLLLTNRRVDLIRERFDLAIRAGALQQEDSSYIARRIAQSGNGLYASPDFIEQSGKPSSVDDLDQYLMVGFASEEGFENKAGLKAKIGKRTLQLTPNYRLKVNDMTTYLESALLGLGIAFLPSGFIQQHLENKSLLPVLPELEFPEVGLYALYPTRHLKSAKLKVFLEYLKTWDPMI